MEQSKDEPLSLRDTQRQNITANAAQNQQPNSPKANDLSEVSEDVWDFEAEMRRIQNLLRLSWLGTPVK